ncbi:zinc-binding alcohol dehydrogenase family protein [Gammaproteobacteria bacterium AS21]
MKAIGYTQSLAIENKDSLQDIELDQPIATGRDVLVKVKAIAVNPVDTKIRNNVAPPAGEYKVIGWDAVGEIVATGEQASTFAIGDSVYYAGALSRAGCNAQYQLVDERIIAHKPKSLTDSQAAALPLTSITAWEMLFDHLAIKQQPVASDNKSDEVVLVVGAAGGVGSILIQILKAISGATIIATASRESSQAWVKKLGADYVVDHTKPLAEQVQALNIGQVTHVASLNGTGSYFDSYTQMLAPFGKIALIDGPESIDFTKLKAKSLSLHYVFMFTRSAFATKDMAEQGRLLARVAELVDLGVIQTTVGKHLGVINAENLRAAHQELESGTSIGKIVLEDF